MVNTWRPENWISEISFKEISKISPRLVSMMTIKEKKLYESGADAMYESVMKARPTEEEIKIRLLDPLLGGGSVPELLDWLKEKLLIRSFEWMRGCRRESSNLYSCINFRAIH